MKKGRIISLLRRRGQFSEQSLRAGGWLQRATKSVPTLRAAMIGTAWGGTTNRFMLGMKNNFVRLRAVESVLRSWTATFR